jgi:hypothetical protein
MTGTSSVAAFKAARRVSAPIVVIRTADQFAAVELIRRSLNGNAPPMLAWDLCRGLNPLNELGTEAFDSLNVEPIMTINPTEMLGLTLKLPERSIVFLYNAHRIVSNETVSQGIWNVREQFKQNGRTLVLLGPDMPLPSEIGTDALVIDEALPDRQQLLDIVNDQLDAASIRSKVDDNDVAAAIDAVAGLAAFPAEQAIALSLRQDGIDLPGLWERKRQMIEQTPGLAVWRGGETFDDIGGCSNVKTFGQSILAGAEPPRAVVFIDEIEKAMGGTQGDTSGVSQEMLGTLLSWMQDKQVTGMLLLGPPGAAKSAYAKALGNTAGVPTIQFDLSGMKGSLVGESGRNLRTALKVVDAVSQGQTLVIATCNSVTTLPPELRRRFQFGTFFFDLPSAEEREKIWEIWAAKYKVVSKLGTRPKDEDWTGAEIRSCCDIARRLNITFEAAGRYIVPVARSAADQIAKLREGASGRYISASEPGIYQVRKSFTGPGKRSIETE